MSGVEREKVRDDDNRWKPNDNQKSFLFTVKLPRNIPARRFALIGRTEAWEALVVIFVFKSSQPWQAASVQSTAPNSLCSTRSTQSWNEAFPSGPRCALKWVVRKKALLAAKCVFSYDPNSTRKLELVRQFAPLIEQISQLAETYGQKLQQNMNNPEHWTTLGYCSLTLGDFPNAFVAYSHALRAKRENLAQSFGL
jgi:hypothetical protein